MFYYYYKKLKRSKHVSDDVTRECCSNRKKKDTLPHFEVFSCVVSDQKIQRHQTASSCRDSQLNSVKYEFFTVYTNNTIQYKAVCSLQKVSVT